MPGLIWIVVGVCLAGAVQDMLVLAASVRRGGRSLAEIARTDIGALAGGTASVAILFVVVIALSGLGVVVVKALGGEEIKLAAGTTFQLPVGAEASLWRDGVKDYAKLPPGTRIVYPNGAEVVRSEEFTVARALPADERLQLDGPRSSAQAVHNVTPLRPSEDGALSLPDGVTQAVRGSSWGTFTIACTVPIALAIGLYMYKIRKGRVVEASILGAAAVLAATVAGNWVPGSALEPYFQLTRNQTIVAICAYGFIASVLPVWLLLCPRDYLSSFLKIGTVALLVGAVIVANPRMNAPMVNEFFVSGGGPYFKGALFPFCFICIMCGAISGFHALVASGTTPKMISRESDVRPIGYGAMLIEGLVGIMALIAAASLPPGDYWAINIDLSQVSNYADTLEKMDAGTDNLALIEQQVGGESLRGRTGGAVTLAVGMAQIFRDAMSRIGGGAIDLESVIKYWYHFAIMFEALFILTTIDTGTRIARFLLQEALGKVYAPFDRTDWLPGAVLSTAAVTAAWGGLIWTGSIDTIWPMFGIANQVLAVIALAVVTTVMVNAGRGRYAPLTILPMLFVIATTLTAGYQMITGPFMKMIADGWSIGGLNARLMQGILNIGFTALVIGSAIIIVSQAVTRWLAPIPQPPVPVAELK
jgi:carbon starvation protein